MKTRRGDNLERMCMSCRTLRNKTDLFRIVRTIPYGDVIVDDTYKAQGRGAYLCKNEECIAKAIKTKSISRVLKKDAFTCLAELKERV